MKTFTQFTEDVNKLEQRRQQLRQRQLDQIEAHKKRVASYRERIQKQNKKREKREQIKNEIKKELQMEQTPHMVPNEYNKQVAKQSARWKGQQIRQSHDEMEREAYAQLSAKKQRLKAIMQRQRDT